MLRALRRRRLSRLGAGLLVLALAGIPRLAVQAAPEPAHRCQCPRHAPGEECSCPQCRAAARRAQEAELEKLPPCHRAAARQAAQAERDEPAGPCLRGSCGNPEDHPATATGLDPFTLPGGSGPPAAPVAGRAPLGAPTALQVPQVPETPPPRR